MSPEYAEALEQSRMASRTFAEAQAAYRSRKIGDAEFLSAKAKHDEAMRAFDAAYALEEAR
jgi:hypothetical protein